MSKLVLFVLSLTMVTGAMAQEPTAQEPGFVENAKAKAELIEQNAGRLAEKIADKLRDQAAKREDALFNAGIMTVEGVVIGQKALRMGRASGKKSGFVAGQTAAQAELKAAIAEAHAVSAGGRAEAAIKEAIEKTFAGNSAAAVIKNAGGAPLVKVEFVNAGDITKEVATTVNSTTGGILGFGKKTVEVEAKETVQALFEVGPGSATVSVSEVRRGGFASGAGVGSYVVEVPQQITHGYLVRVVRPAQWGLMVEKAGFEKSGVEGFLTQVSDGVAAAINSKATTEIKDAFGGAVPTGAEVRGAILSAGETHTVTVQALESEIKTVARLRDTGRVVEEVAEKAAPQELVLVAVKKGAPGVFRSGISFAWALAKKLPAGVYIYSAGDFCYRVGDAVMTGDSPGLTFVDDVAVHCVDAWTYLTTKQDQ